MGLRGLRCVYSALLGITSTQFDNNDGLVWISELSCAAWISFEAGRFKNHSGLARAWLLCNKGCVPMRLTQFAKLSCLTLLLCAALPLSGQTAGDPGLKIFNLAAAQPTTPTPPTPAVALVGGGADVDEAMEFLCQNSGGGNIVVLRASGDDDYNPYFHNLCLHNSVTTLLITSVEGARDPAAAEILRNAHAIFIAGGDQFNYVKMWTGNPVQTEINEAIARGVPIGGISAGLAVLGEFAFSARHDTVTSPEALANPYDEKVSLERNFLSIPLMKGIITDSHFSKRERMGRTLVFLARIVQDGWSERSHAIGIDEKTAVLVDAKGQSKVVGKGEAFFIDLSQKPEICAPGKPLTARSFYVYSFSAGAKFDLTLWDPGKCLIPFRAEVIDGKLPRENFLKEGR
jgi:cyanophycinase